MSHELDLNLILFHFSLGTHLFAKTYNHISISKTFKLRTKNPHFLITKTIKLTSIAFARLANPTTNMPALAKATARLAPIPALAPVTTATLPIHLSITHEPHTLFVCSFRLT